LKSESPMAYRMTDATMETGSSELNTVAARLGERASEETAAKCARHFGSALRAVILTGSLARGEGSVASDGIPGKLASDAEFVVILHDRVRLPKSPDVTRLSGEIESRLAAGGVQCHISLSCAHDDFLRKMRPHIFAYELKTCGKILFGEQEILSLIPRFAPTDIPLEDGWRLLSNRMIEMAEALSETYSMGSGPVSQNVFYRAEKLQLDTATSLLIFTGNYAPSYRERRRKMNDLARQSLTVLGLPFSLTQVANLVGDCTDWKLSSNSAVDETVDWQWVVIACRNASLLWEWELRKMTKAEGELSPSELCMRLMRQQPLAARMRGWLYLMRHRGWYRSMAEWPRWLQLARHASPRYWLYAATGELYMRQADVLIGCSGPGLDSLSAGLLRDCLPMLPPDASREPRDGKAIARAIAWNYHQFLEGTGA
jgi:hypothetical protein